MCFCCPPAINAILCLWIRSGFSKASVAGVLTFFPPEPALYKFRRVSSDGETIEDEEEFEDDETDTSTTGIRKDPDSQMESLSIRTKKLKARAKIRYERDTLDAKNGVSYILLLDPRLRPPPSFSGNIEPLKIFSKKSKSFVALVIYRQREKGLKTIIYSHGNATDIGAMSMMQSVIANNLNVNVVMYDYSGYGESGGMALEHNTYYDIETVFNYCVENVSEGVPENLIIYGQSVGSGPSCHLSAKKPVGALILHSPFTSGMRVLTPSRALACLDIFPNIDRIKHVKCPVLLIHGKLDEEVGIEHGVSLYEAVPDQYKREPWWVPDRGHNDICEGSSKIREYIDRLKIFLDSMDDDDMAL